MTTLFKVYKTTKLEFRRSSSNPWIYVGYLPNSNTAYEEMCEGWGWILAAFNKQQLEELEDWHPTNEPSSNL